jgi:2-keto-myo-inositol isomerase
MLIGWNGQMIPALPLDEELEVVSAAGYDGIELLIFKLPSYLESHTAGDLARSLRKNGLAPLTINCIENFNLRPPGEFGKVREECRWLSELSQEIGCPGVAVVPSARPEGMAWEQIKTETVSALQDLADVAAPYGVQLGFEFLAPANNSVRTLAQGWEIVQAAGRENVGLVIDTYHFYVGGSSWESLEEFDIDRLLVVHINDVEGLPLEQLTDGDRMLPGEGVIPLHRILSRLHARGYDGAYSLEVMRPAYRKREPLEYARAGLEATRKALASATRGED